MRRGLFSLIELLIVVAIIIVLVSLLQPALRKAIESANVAVCLQNQRNIGIAFMLFGDDHNGTMPTTSFGPGGQPSKNNKDYGTGLAWQQNFYGSTHLKGDDYKRVQQRHWHKNIDGPIWDYLAVSNFKKIFRCPSTEAANNIGINSGYYNNLEREDIGAIHSNGVFDYAGMEAFGGAKMSRIPQVSYMLNPYSYDYIRFGADDLSKLEAMPTPLLVEEDPAFSINNGLWSETSHGSIDEMGTWHDGRRSVYMAVDGSAHAVQFDLRGCKPWEWRIEHYKYGFIQLDGQMKYGDWDTREARGLY